MSMPAGTMADHWGIKRTLVLGQIVIAAGLLAVSAAGSYPTLIVLMIVAGFGYGMLNPTSTKAVMAWFPPAQRATVIGLKQVGLPFGGALGAALMPALALAVGWRLAVVTSALVILSTAVASLLIYRDPAGLPPPTTGARTAFRAVLLTRDLWLVAIATLMFAAVQTVFMAFLVLYLTDVVALPLLVAGRYLALAHVAGMAGRIAFGMLSDRTFGGRRRAPLALAGIGSALCSVAVAMTGPGSGLPSLASIALVFGFCGIGWNGVQHTLMAELAGARAGGAPGAGRAGGSPPRGGPGAPDLWGWRGGVG